MDYSLAKQLKEAGFPVKEFLYDEKNYVISISLEQVIEELGDEFFALKFVKPEWIAVSLRDDASNLHIVGKTPLEAVVKLYIKLNK